MKLTAFRHVKRQDDGDCEFLLSLSTLEDICICSTTARGLVTSKQLDVIQKSIWLLRPGRKVSTRSSFTLSLPRPSCDGTDQFHPRTLSSCTLTAKILVPNAGTLLDEPGLPRQGDFLDFFGPDTSTKSNPWSPKDFYENVHVPARSGSSDLPPIRELQCALYPFQRRAIRWLLEREGFLNHTSGEASRPLPHNFVHIKDGDGRDCFVSRLLGLATTNEDLIRSSSRDLRGGILAEEMGLGKTVEVISLIYLHRRIAVPVPESNDPNPIPSSKATLIITPPAILQQWKDELQTLAPSLNVTIYNGMRLESQKNDDTELMQKCLMYDVVLTTYPTLARDIHYAEAPPRNLRHEKKYEKRLSPLTKIHWWRVVLDEAQMVESGVSNAARVASLIPRQHAWCVSGTPARNAKDLLGLLVFLQYRPYCQLPLLWERLVDQYRDILTETFREITLRHTKSQIKNDLHLPHQKRIVINVPFTTIEEQHYSSLFQQMADDCGLDLNGSPIQEDWNPEDQQVIERMRTWLVRLRQTCLHPEVGSRNRKALGNSKGPLRTVSEVLDVMIEQNETMIRTEERNLLLSQIRRGQIHEHAKRSQAALDIWLSTLDEIRKIVQECRRQLQMEFQKVSVEKEDVILDRSGEAVANARTGPSR